MNRHHNYLLIFCLLISIITFLSLPVHAKNNPVVRPKIGIALGGGGARGAAHIGVLKVFERENIPVDYLVGTSAGALIASLYAGGVGLDELEYQVLSGAIEKVYKIDFSLFRAAFVYMNRTCRTILRRPFYAGLYNDRRLQHFVDNLISKDDGKIKIFIPLHIIALDLISALPVLIKSGDVGLAVQASAAIPSLHQPIPINDQLLIDGGVVQNIPVEEARKMGADIVIAIDVDAKPEEAKSENFRSFEGVITRVINLGLLAQSELVLEKADIVISPDLNGVGILDLDTQSLIKAIKAGEDEAIKMIPKIKKKIEQKTSTLNIAEY